MFEDAITETATAATEVVATESAFAVNSVESFMQLLESNDNLALAVLLIYNIWILVWKGLALWKAGRLNQKFWFIAILCLNTLGLLEIAYLFFFSKQDWQKIGEKIGIQVNKK